MVPAQGMGPQIEQAGWSKEGQDRSRAEAGHHFALYLDRRYGVLVDASGGNHDLTAAAQSSRQTSAKRGPPGRRVPMTAKVRVASTVQTAKGVEYIAASATDTHHEAIIDLGKNREPG